MVDGNSFQKKILKEDQLLLKLCHLTKSIIIEDYAIELLDIHIHPDGIGSSLVNHEHKFTEIHLIDSGTGRLYTRGKSYEFSQGQFTITPPGQTHHWEQITGPLVMHIWWLKIPESKEPNSMLSEIARLMACFSNAQSVVYELPKKHGLYYAHLLEELGKQEINYRSAINYLLSLLLVSLARKTVKRKHLKTKLPLENVCEQDRLVQIIDHFMKDNLAAHFSLAEVAKITSMSKRSITRHYKSVTGFSIGDNFNQFRMYKAEELLRETNKQIKSIALEVGFNDTRYFSRKFRQFFKCSASEFRQKLVWLPTRPNGPCLVTL
ncbi:MAG: hypothetical protein A2Y12_14160 [Planctomycetes bacterium GWF2_42_9]|nr:MAG: hypothetical protein A2Y12_14160 [Planctomycetes bacterium GWF2_42_9]